MAQVFYSDLDLKQNELKNFTIKRGALPIAPVQDQFAVDTDGKLKQYDGAQWVEVGIESFTAGEAISIVDGLVDVKYDDLTVGLNGSNQLEVKDSSIGKAKLSNDIAGSGLTQDIDGSIKLADGYAENIGDGATTSFTITHNLNTKDVIVQVVEIATGEAINVDIARDTVNTVVVNFGSLAPAQDSFRVLIKAIL
jgi:hypothetical protein